MLMLLIPCFPFNNLACPLFHRKSTGPSPPQLMSEMPCPADPHDTAMLMLLIPRFCGSGPASTCYVTARAAVGRGLSQLTVSCEGPGTKAHRQTHSGSHREWQRHGGAARDVTVSCAGPVAVYCWRGGCQE